MEEQLKERFTKLANSYTDSPQNRTEILFPFYKEISQLPAKERYALHETASNLFVRTRKNKDGEIIEWRPCGEDCLIFLSSMRLLIDNPRSAYLPVSLDNHVSLLCDLLEIYCPSWIKHLKFKPTEGGRSVSYLTYMTLAKRGFVETIEEPLLANMVGQLPWYNSDYTGRIFLEHKELLEEHVWLLFRYDTPIAWNDDNAITAFKEGRTKINGSLEALVMGRSKGSWFVGIIEELHPTSAELLPHQDLILQGLTTKLPGFLKLLLRLLRQLADETTFNYNDFIAAISGLLYDMAQTNMSVVCATFESIVKQHVNARADICRSLCLVFMNKSEAAQKRAAKLIAKFGDKNDETLCSELRSYEAEMRQEPREMLAAFIPQKHNDDLDIAEEVSFDIMPLKRCRHDNRLVVPKDKDEAIFLLSSALFKMDSLQLQLAFAAAVEWAPKLNIDDLGRLESLFEEARKWSSDAYLDEDRLLGMFFLEFGSAVEQRFKVDETSMKSRFMRFADSARGLGNFRAQSFTRLKSYKVRGYNSEGETLLKHLLTDYVEILSFDTSLPILSTPTHKPAWVNAETLIERLAKWQQARVQLLSFDRQLARLRCAVDDVSTALTCARKLLKGELLHLMLYLLGEEKEPVKPVTLDTAWTQAQLIKEARESIHGDLSFDLTKELNIITKVNREWADYGKKPNCYDVFSRVVLDNIFFALRKKQLFQNFIDIRGIWWHYLAQTVVSFFPAFPAPLFSTILHNYCVFSNAHADDKMWVGYGLAFLHEAQVPVRGILSVFVAYCMASSEATTRVSAIELCMERRLQNYGEQPAICLDSIGEILANFLKHGLFPLSRLTKLLKDQYWGQEKQVMLHLGELLLPVNKLLETENITGGKAFLKLCKEMGITT